MNEQKNSKPSRPQKCFRVAFDFLLERLRVLEKVGNTHGFWEATTDIMTFRASQMGNDPLLMGLLCECLAELERAAKGDAA